MKQRLTYLLPAGTGLEKSDVKVGNETLEFAKSEKASQEWRITLGFNELPHELRLILRECHEIHLRWSSPRNDEVVPPLVSRLPPGLHVFFTPRKGYEPTATCELLQKLLDSEAKCESVYETFARIFITSERFAQTSTFQWHQYSPIRSSTLADVFLEKICATAWTDVGSHHPCKSLVPELSHAAYVDIDFDTISHTLIFTAHWPIDNPVWSSPDLSRVQREYRKAGDNDRLEIGTLQAEKADDVEKLSLGGFLTIIGEDDRPSPTLFSFPSRHHPLPQGNPATFTASLQRPTGLHPKLQLHLPRKLLTPPKDSCALHTYMTLPSALFVDRYQLSDRLFLASQNLVALHSLAGEHDLEAPDWVSKRWGSASLLELAVPRPLKKIKPSPAASDDWIVTIPLHLRYISHPAKSTDQPHEATVDVPWPIVFWACDAEEGLKMSTNPFDRSNLGYEGLFGPKTMFYHVPPAPESRLLVETLTVPILNVDNYGMVQAGTLGAVVLGFLWVCWRLFGAVGMVGARNRAEKKVN